MKEISKLPPVLARVRKPTPGQTSVKAPDAPAESRSPAEIQYKETCFTRTYDPGVRPHYQWLAIPTTTTTTTT
eukprot:2322153-Rhodomonas_salina.1